MIASFAMVFDALVFMRLLTSHLLHLILLLFKGFFFLTLTSAAFDFSVVPPSVLHFSKNFFFIRASRIVELKILFYFLFRIANGTRSKEEKEVLDMFGSIFSLIEIGVFKEIMSNNIEVTNLLKIWLSTFNFDCTA